MNSSEPGISHRLTQVLLTTVFAEVAHLVSLSQSCGDLDPGHFAKITKVTDQSLLRLTSTLLKEDRFGSQRSLGHSHAGKGFPTLRILVTIGLWRCFSLNVSTDQMQLPSLAVYQSPVTGAVVLLVKEYTDDPRDYFTFLLVS